MRARALAAAVVLAVALAPVAHAQSDEVAELIDLVAARPAGMERDEWRVARRDAARKLGSSGDRRAVPVLIEVVESEKFDAVAEIAIESLGQLGDSRAAPVLRRVVEDSSRDRYIRSAAREALKNIGAEVPDDPASGDPDEPGAGAVSSTLGGDSMVARSGSVESGPTFDRDTLAAYDRLQLAVGGARLEYDTVRSAPSVDADLAARYTRIRENEGSSTAISVEGSFVGGAVDYDGPGNTSRALAGRLGVDGEGRMYATESLYGVGLADANTTLDHIKVNRPGTGADTSDTFAGADLGVALGAGLGRVLAVGEGLRLARIEQALKRARVLGRPITPDLAERIFSAWWALRGEHGYHDRLIATVTILREAGVLLQEPDASTTYKILRVLEDGQLDGRPRGYDVSVLVGESYALRDEDTGIPDGRRESVLARARYGHQSETGTREIIAFGQARARILTETGDPAPWLASAGGAFRLYRYSERQDPLGALELTAEVGASDDDLMMSETASRVGASIGWLWFPARAQRMRLAASGRVETGEIFLGAVFSASWGLVDGAFLSSQTYASP